MPLCITCHDLDINDKIYLEENYRLSKNENQNKNFKQTELENIQEKIIKSYYD